MNFAGSFISTSLLQKDLVRWLIMYGFRQDDKVDIPSGKVYGVCINYRSNSYELGDEDLGLSSMNREPKHY